MSDSQRWELKFNTWEAFVNQAENGETDMLDYERSSRNADDEKWAGGSFKNAIDLARNGWKDGADRIAARIDTVTGMLPSYGTRRELVMERVGPGAVDMGRYLMGHPAPYITWKNVEDENSAGDQIIPILFNVTASAGVSVETMFNKGAVLCVLIDQLERAGKRVELTVALAATNGSYSGTKGDHVTLTVMVKRANDALDVDRIAFSLAHAACLRRLGFSLWEQAPKEIRDKIGIKKSSGYGRPEDVVAENYLVIPSSDLNTFDHQSDEWKKWLQDKLSSFGVEWEIDVDEKPVRQHSVYGSR